MRQFNRVLATACMLVACAACEREAPALSQQDQDAIRAVTSKYAASALAADWDTWGATLAPDVFYSPPNLAPLSGRAAAVAWAKTFPKITALTVTPTDVTGRGDLAYSRGTYTLSVTLPDGSAMTEHGSFLDVHRRQADGSWPYTHVMFHSTDPIPAPLPSKAK